MPKYKVTGYVSLLNEVMIIHEVEAKSEELALKSAVDLALYENTGFTVGDDLDVEEIKD